MKVFTCLSILLLALLLVGCASTERVSGVYHRVQPNETLTQIARAYGTTPESIAAANHIDDINIIERDRILFIPHAPVAHPPEPAVRPAPTREPERPVADVERRAAPRAVKEETLKPEARPPAPDRDTVARTPERPAPSVDEPRRAPGDTLQFRWPFAGSVTSRFGAQPGGTKMNGISIESETASPVTASEGGTVLHSAPIKFYGETIIIRHGNDYLTIYSQLEKRAVQTGDRVSRGDTIGTPGKNETNGRYAVYFEMRRNNRPVDPLTLLPKR